ncbi:predicted protein [Lichtheimia corymbifera JMRC:FSU:9682]|uniref:BHLH domain-containing protein n=1 Tax=Lichtheimia corymbifera JMRC:FSU:9682 TaxID=1263082 RepID=A0A068RUS3_9FUNG|nr:predicted protein [Lichtheimia corymbifera JMRC:FSU:9682]
MSTSTPPQPSKLHNPTAYHLMASSNNTSNQDWSSSSTQPVDYSSSGDDFAATGGSIHDFDDFEYTTHNHKKHVQHNNSLLQHQQQQQHHHPYSQARYLMDDDYYNPAAAQASSSSFYDSPPPRMVARHPFPMSAPADIGLSDLYNMNPAVALPPQQQQQFDASTGGSLQDDYAMQMNLQLMMEKKRRRRESHNAVERRRRENINDRIQELGSLLPEPMLEECNSNCAGGTSNKPNKGAILRKSVDHIRLLQQDVNTYRHRIQELESVLNKIQQQKRKSV